MLSFWLPWQWGVGVRRNFSAYFWQPGLLRVSLTEKTLGMLQFFVVFFLVLWDHVRGVCVFGWKLIWGMGCPSILLWWFVLVWDVLGAVLAHCGQTFCLEFPSQIWILMGLSLLGDTCRAPKH